MLDETGCCYFSVSESLRQNNLVMEISSEGCREAGGARNAVDTVRFKAGQFCMLMD